MPTEKQEKTHIGVTIVVILALIFFYPLGVILMWFLTKWPRWAKIVITLLLVIPIIAVFLSISLIAVNPARQFAQAYDTQRKSDVNAISNAISQYYSDNNTLPPGLQNLPAGTTTGITANNPAAGTEFCNALVPDYMAELPADPKVGRFESCNDFNTSYTITVNQNPNGGSPTVTISANPQIAPSISVTR